MKKKAGHMRTFAVIVSMLFFVLVASPALAEGAPLPDKYLGEKVVASQDVASSEEVDLPQDVDLGGDVAAPQANKTVTAIDALPSEVASQMFAFGTLESDISDALPSSFTGTVDDTPHAAIPVSGWTSVAYDSSLAGPHIFVPTIDETNDTYDITGLAKPKITITLEKNLQQMINDATTGTRDNPQTVHIATGSLASKPLPDVLQINEYDGQTLGDVRHVQITADPGVELVRGANIVGAGEPLIHVNPASTLDLENITITGNANMSHSLINVSDGGILTLGNNSVLKDNQTEESAGAVTSVGGLVVMEPGSKIQNCHGLNGGAIYSSEGTNYLTGGLIEGCSAMALGGAIYSDTHDYVSLTGTSITRCSASSGGGVFSLAEMEMISGKITDCEADVYGGAIVTSGGAVDNDGNLIPAVCTLQGGEISGNRAIEGGAINTFYNSTLALVGTNILNNTATEGGGAISAAGAVWQSAGRIANNVAGTSGGAILIFDKTVDIPQLSDAPDTLPSYEMTGGTIENNQAEQYGGGIAVNAHYREEGGIRTILITLASGTIRGNSTASGEGSAIHVYGNNAANVCVLAGADISGDISLAAAGTGGMHAVEAASTMPPEGLLVQEAAPAADVAQKQLVVDGKSRIDGTVTLAQSNPMLLQGTLSAKIQLKEAGFATQSDFDADLTFTAYKVGDVVGMPAIGHTITKADVEMIDAGVPLKLENGNIVVAEALSDPDPDPDPDPNPDPDPDPDPNPDPDPDPDPNPDPDPEKKIPHTGDSSNPWLLAILCTSSAAVLGALLLIKRRTQRKGKRKMRQ